MKTNIGHLEAAAGIAGLIKLVLALEHEQLPRHLHFETPNPLIPWDTLPVRVTTEATPWPRGAARRLAGVSSFGFSGTNAHIVLEEAPTTATKPAAVERPLHLLTLSARTEPALRDLAERYDRHLSIATDPLADLCFTANAGRSHFEQRLAVLASSGAEARQRLAMLAAGEVGAGCFRGGLESKSPPAVAFRFPGHVSAYVGMGQQLFQTQPTFREIVLRCEGLLKPHLPRLLTDLLFDGEIGDRALFALEVAPAELWQSWGIVPDFVLGEGVGEYAAACAAGVVPLEEAVSLVTSGRRLDDVPAVRDWRAQARQRTRYAADPSVLKGQDRCLLVDIGPQKDGETEGGLPSLRAEGDDWTTLLTSVARLYVAGAAVDWAAFDRDYSRRKVSLPTYPFQRQRYWVEVEPARTSNVATAEFLTAPTEVAASLEPAPPSCWTTSNARTVSLCPSSRQSPGSI